MPKIKDFDGWIARLSLKPPREVTVRPSSKYHQVGDLGDLDWHEYYLRYQIKYRFWSWTFIERLPNCQTAPACLFTARDRAEQLEAALPSVNVCFRAVGMSNDEALRRSQNDLTQPMTA
ncbi:MAG TPA: hypothetical protein VLE72_01870 [Candidatus Saccharimonadales bacterium]|nr:hypothetical protein [Candidatus Saccharimonadales bacterium]